MENRSITRFAGVHIDYADYLSAVIDAYPQGFQGQARVMAENAIFYWQQNSHLSTKSDMERLLKHGQPRQGDILSAVHFHECLAPELFKFLGEESMPRLSQKVEAAMAANDHDINHAHGHDLGKALATLGDYLSQCAALVKQSSGDQYYTAQELADRALKSIVDPGIQSNLAI